MVEENKQLELYRMIDIVVELHIAFDDDVTSFVKP